MYNYGRYKDLILFYEGRGRGNEMEYLAHRKENNNGDFTYQLLRDHLTQTAELSGRFSEAFGCYEWGYLAGLLHDAGKYSAAFQYRIKENGPRVDHSTAGAKLNNNILMQYVITGHHTGLLDYGSTSDVAGTRSLEGRKKKDIPDVSFFSQEININGVQLQSVPIRPMEKNNTFHVAYFVKMLYSCLVDADFLDTEAFMSDQSKMRQGFLRMEQLYERLQTKLQRFLQGKASSEINIKRNEILRRCIKTGQEGDRGMYALTVPTGGGKTLASLAFAMEQAREKGMTRIIYVIPYTSIIDQTVEVFSEIFGPENVIAHHSQINYEDQFESSNPAINRKKLATENWDAPIIVTTNVQFFESIYGNRSSTCRKLHNIVNSVIIFDEAQMLPLYYLRPCVWAIAELVHNYHCSAVLCTATQPSLARIFPECIKIKEICDDYADLYNFFRRVTYKSMGKVDKEELKITLNEQKQVLCVVNSRRHAVALFKVLDGEGNFHLSTWMIPAHRKIVLAEIKDRLKKGMVCRVVSTSLIEAGVDVDFPMAFRELAGLDSIIQTGGRCNREGRQERDKSIVKVFQWLDGKIPRSMEQHIDATKIAVNRHEAMDSPECIKDYFDLLLGLKSENLDLKGILKKLYSPSCHFPFETIGKAFQIIEENTKSVYIPYNDNAKELLMKFKNIGPSRTLLRKMGMYTVNVYPWEYEALRSHGTIEQLDDQWSVLNTLKDYSDKVGLVIPEKQLGDAIII